MEAVETWAEELRVMEDKKAKAATVVMEEHKAVTMAAVE